MTPAFSLRAGLAAAVLLFAGSAAAQDLHAFADPSRLVSIGGSLTEIVYALGEQDKLIARDQTALYPPEALDVPDIGYMRQLSPESVLSVGPSALMVLEGSGPPEALEVLESAGVEYQTVPESFTAEGVLAKIRAVGTLLDDEAKAEQLVAEVEAQFKALADKVAAIETPRRVLFVLSTQGGKIQAAGTGTAANGILVLAGAQNVITDYSGYKALTDEAIIAAAPEVILMMDRGGEHAAGDAELFANPAIAQTPAGKAHAIIRLEGAYLLGFGPRTAAAAAELADALYGAN